MSTVTMSGVTGSTVGRLDAMPAAEAAAALTACCASPAWVRAVLAGRPYRSPAALRSAVAAAFDGLSWPEIEAALAAHPRLGERAAGADRSAAWSRREQAGVGAGTDAERAALAAGNRAYERKFGRVYLACATGRSAAELVALLRSRLDNDEATERAVVRRELRAITELRLAAL
jgi:2-oxo-4-hydroxy-4-carboxy-5-ureidoimidazoline decarboxylase